MVPAFISSSEKQVFVGDEKLQVSFKSKVVLLVHLIRVEGTSNVEIFNIVGL
jgi:hypothetical protein